MGKDLSTKTFGFNWLFIKRTFQLSRLFFVSWICLPSVLFYFLLSMALLEQMLIYYVGIVPSKYYTALGSRDLNYFWSTTVNGLLSICALVFVMTTKTYICNILYITWRRILTTTIHQHYFFNIQYYRLNVTEDLIDNPDQRLTQDVDKMCYVWSKIIDIILVAPFRIGYYTYASYMATGYAGPVAVFVYFLVGTIINKLLMSPVVRFVAKQEKMEGNFRFKHMQVRSNAESLAFLNGGAAEADETNRKLDALIQIQMRLFNRQYPLTISINIFDYFGSILSYLLIAIPIFGGEYDSFTGVQLSSLISQTSFVCMYLVNSFSQLVDQASKITDIAGCTHRVAQLIEILTKADELVIPKTYDSTEQFQQPDVICVLENVSFGAPNNDTNLVEKLNLVIEKKVNLLITGDSGSGKSSFLRVLRGLWPCREGRIYNYCQRSSLRALFLPQKPYFPGGNLYRQIVFPLDENDHDSVEVTTIMQYLKLANLEKLVERSGGLFVDPEWNWCDVLSPGELQRLSFIRLFYHHPQVAYLDEASSALNKEMETTLHRQCEILGITLISVGHRESLRRFHQVNLHLNGSGDRGSWHVSAILHQ